MARPPLHAHAMTRIVKFRLETSDYEFLQQLSHGGPVSIVLRDLVRAERERRAEST
jgi:hypothetical protein